MELLALLAQPATVASVISFAVVIITLLLRNNFGETESDRLLKIGQNALRTAQLIAQAAEYAVIEVEKAMKESGQMTNDELKETAVRIAGELLQSWGVVVNDQILYTLFSVVETAYQNLKKRGFTTS